ncbi:hypothetical protein F3Y22_tig00112382pilonHSYRG00155 [Hibiscus syriacus]|uniref:BURP domain-containing protein n=1 Tax=Hibiscus syriacus TaxID=106335 RepID=A0A6A2X0A5_HIBSY|nr:hypothetical protein F3Y22_tig00112382pilonHSYRG00155 [Hibiscus syriacus]
MSDLQVVHVVCSTSTGQAKVNPFTPKASLIRYWSSHISNTLTKSPFFVSKASPLSAVDSAKPTIADDNSFQGQQEADFEVYSSKSFKGCGTSRRGGVDSFKNYSDGLNTPNESFKKYRGGSNGHREEFNSYVKDANVAVDNFTNYGSGATGGSGGFNSYQERVKVPNLRFTSYDSGGTKHKLSFSGYSSETNSGTQAFNNYGKKGKSDPTEFTSYSGNNPHNSFKTYGLATKLGIDSFTGYRDSANVGDDSFQSYARDSDYFSQFGIYFVQRIWESVLKEGNVMVMPDIVDKMPRRSFLPRRPASRGETKLCVGSAEDMIDFATSVLGHNVTVRTTKTVKGSKKEIMIGEVKGINSENVTKLVSCHQSLYVPTLLLSVSSQANRRRRLAFHLPAMLELPMVNPKLAVISNLVTQ